MVGGAAGVAAEDCSLSTQELSPDFKELIPLGLKMNACSLSQLRAFGEAFPGGEIGVRFNPGLGSGGTGKTNVGGPSSSFGIWHEAKDEVAAIAEEFGLKVVRVHTHIGSGSDPAVWQRVAGMSLDLVRLFPAVTTLNLGGGYKVGRMAGEKSTELSVVGAPVAAAFEAYYRSALNSLMNASLTGTKSALFPNMHVQIPTRVLYINGFKATRQWLTNEVDARTQHQADDGDSRSYLLLVPALLPGVLMTPISGVLEASNAGHSNPEPLYRRAFRGFVPRCLREVIFGVGLNQLSDYCEERVPESFATSKVLRNAVGSLVAGLFAGYLSHVPHNLSTMKLLQPQVRAYAVS